jgi:hypothetical protein
VDIQRPQRHASIVSNLVALAALEVPRPGKLWTARAA